MWSHITTLVAALVPTVPALLAFFKAREASKNTDLIIVQTNGTLTVLHKRNAQLVAELSKNDVPIPPVEGDPHAGNS